MEEEKEEDEAVVEGRGEERVSLETLGEVEENEEEEKELEVEEEEEMEVEAEGRKSKAGTRKSGHVKDSARKTASSALPNGCNIVFASERKQRLLLTLLFLVLQP